MGAMHVRCAEEYTQLYNFQLEMGSAFGATCLWRGTIYFPSKPTLKVARCAVYRVIRFQSDLKHADANTASHTFRTTFSYRSSDLQSEWSTFRVTGGELFEDIVAREFYSEADARWVKSLDVFFCKSDRNWYLDHFYRPVGWKRLFAKKQRY